MKILLFGKDGQVGWELQRTLASLGPVEAYGRRECDFGSPDQVQSAVRRAEPDVIVNAAAYNAVDRAEAEAETAHLVNGYAPGLLAEEAARRAAALVHFSTDYVFDGEKGAPYLESDPANPLSAYGRSKLAGEKAVAAVGRSYLVLRTSWVYSLRRDSFVTKVLSWARQYPQLRVVTDQVGSPTWARLLAETTAQVLAMASGSPAAWLAARSGVYHLAGGGQASRYEWAQAILEADPSSEEQTAKSIQPAESIDFPTPAIRPAFSALNCDRFETVFGLRLPHWQSALPMALDQA